MIIVGLTGIIGSGKSTVAALLGKQGLPVIDFDALARMSLTWEETRVAIRDAFGLDYVLDDRVDVERLRQTVFAASRDLRRIEEIIHPLVAREVERQLVALEKEGARTAVIDHPLLFEVGFHRPVDKIVVVSARLEIIRERLKIRGMKSEDIERRISFQTPLEEKEKQADYIIDNNGAEDRLQGQVDSLIQQITKWEVTRTCI